MLHYSIFLCKNAHCSEKCCLTKLLLQNFLNSSEMLKRAFPTFSESLKGVVTKHFSGGFAPRPPHFSTPVSSGWRRPCLRENMMKFLTYKSPQCLSLVPLKVIHDKSQFSETKTYCNKPVEKRVPSKNKLPHERHR